jgi:hypothetical protein
MSVKEYLDKWYEAKRWEFYAHVRPWIAIGAEMAKTSGWRMTYAQYHDLIDLLDGMNSYERKVLLPVLDDIAVCELTEYCISQYRTLGELDVAVVYDEAVQRELAPLLVKRLRESDGLLKIATQHAKEWGRWRDKIAHLKATASGQQKRADKAEAEHLLVQKDLFKAWEERDAARSEAEAWRKRAAEWETKQHFAQKQAAIWEIEAQDLRDRLVQVEAALTHNTIACVR